MASEREGETTLSIRREVGSFASLGASVFYCEVAGSYGVSRFYYSVFWESAAVGFCYFCASLPVGDGPAIFVTVQEIVKLSL